MCSPFHAAVGILTTRMFLNVRKAANRTSFASGAERNVPEVISDSPFPDNVASWIVAQNSQLPSSLDRPHQDCIAMEHRGVTNQA